MRTLTGLFTIGGGLTWQYFGDREWHGEEGIAVYFPLMRHTPRREALRGVREGLERNNVLWLRSTDGRWFLDLTLLQQSVSNLADLDYLRGKIEIVPDVEDSQEKVFDRVETRTGVRFIASREDILRSQPMKLFLSHKGTDKPMVREFKTILEALGFQPWLDEDALVAGHGLDRGLLQGFKDSCASVFFITPAFRDEAFLSQEVDYAVAEKREKGDRFSIVTLVFADSEGHKGAVPELLKRFVWKTPSSSLEALREILRALPVEVGPTRWRL